MRLRRARGKAGEWYYCLKHQGVEEGPDCPAKNRMGPYTTRGEAERAMQTAAERNQEWDGDPRWHEPGDGTARPEGR